MANPLIIVSTRVIKNISLLPISGAGWSIFLLDRKKKQRKKNRKKTTQRLEYIKDIKNILKYLAVIFRTSTPGTY